MLIPDIVTGDPLDTRRFIVQPFDPMDGRPDMWPKIVVLASLLFTASPLSASDPQDEPAADLLHADVPLFGNETSDKWPRAIGGSEIGCTSRVAFGSWKYQPIASSEQDPVWYPIANYGAFHCWALVGAPTENATAEPTSSKPSFFIFLGKVGQAEIWTLQMGARPGSDYLLLTRKPGGGIIRSFDVLQRECPKSMKRGGRSIEILATEYCSIESRAVLMSLARNMIKRQPLAQLSLNVRPVDDKLTP